MSNEPSAIPMTDPAESASPELEISGAWLVVASRETGYKDASGEVVIEHHIICNDPRINEHIGNTSAELSGFGALHAEPPATGLWFSWCRIIGLGPDEWAIEPLEDPWKRLSPNAAMAVAKGSFTPSDLNDSKMLVLDTALIEVVQREDEKFRAQISVGAAQHFREGFLSEELARSWAFRRMVEILASDIRELLLADIVATAPSFVSAFQPSDADVIEAKLTSYIDEQRRSLSEEDWPNFDRSIESTWDEVRPFLASIRSIGAVDKVKET